jgi:hypothetical protein
VAGGRRRAAAVGVTTVAMVAAVVNQTFFFSVTNKNFNENLHRQSETKWPKHSLLVQNLHTMKTKK